MNKIYEVEDLSFSYSNTDVLDRIKFNIYERDFVGIIGANGSGKSTLLKILVSELKNFAGNVKIFGEDIRQFKSFRKIGYVPQVDRDKSVAFPISVKEMVMLNLYGDFNIFNHPKKKHKQMVKDILEMFNLKEFTDKNYNDLSGGQKQRVMIAKAMVHNPDVLIFDEPTVGIDKSSKEEFFHILEHINRDHGITIIMVTHEMDVADQYFTRKLILSDKKLEEKNVSI